MNIIMTVQADEKLLQALNDLSHSMKLFATTGNALGEVIEAQQPTPAPAAAPTAQPQPTPAPAVAPMPPTAPAAPTAQPAPTAAVPVVPTTAATPSAVPTTEQSYTLDQLAVAATQLMDAGREAELRQLLQQFGVQALTALPKEQYGAFATALRQLGAKI